VSEFLLLKLFARHFSNPESVMQKFGHNIQTAALPFEIIPRLRELQFLPYPSFDSGLPSMVYYYIPGTNWGSHHGHSAESLDPSFVRSGDGIGLNTGCPVRLTNALELPFTLPEPSKKECLNGLCNVHTHLPTVEELLWPTLWPKKSELRRGGNLAGNGSDVDWFFSANGTPIYLEAKFRPADWPRLSCADTHQPMKGFFLGKAAHKFPLPNGSLNMHVVGVTGAAEPTLGFLAKCEDELAAGPTVHAVLYRTLFGSIYIISLDKTKALSVAAIVKAPSLEEYPPTYSFPIDRVSCDERIKQRQQQPQESREPTQKMCVMHVDPPPATPIFIGALPEYRCEIIERMADGEPVFEVIAPYL
jgi:hypothetical protein